MAPCPPPLCGCQCVPMFPAYFLPNVFASSKAFLSASFITHVEGILSFRDLTNRDQLQGPTSIIKCMGAIRATVWRNYGRGALFAFFADPLEKFNEKYLLAFEHSDESIFL